MHSSRHLRRPLVAVASLSLIGTLAACGGGSDSAASSTPGVTDDSILVGTHMPLTGPAAAGYSTISPATKAYFDYVNDKGGVHGRKITYKVKDDGYNPANTQSVVRELVLKDKVFAVVNGLGTPTHTGVLDFLKTNKVPDLFVASGSRSWNQPEKYPTTFGFQADYTTEAKVQATYIKENLADKTVCFLGQDDDFGEDALKGLTQILGEDGVKERQSYVTSNTNVGPQIGKLKAAGCEVVSLATVPGFTALAVGTAARLQFKPQWISTSVGADYSTVAGALGEAAPLLEGFLSTNYLPSQFDDDNEWITLFKKINEDYNKGAPFTGNTVYGMTVGYLFVQALQQNGKELTRQSLIDTIEEGGLDGPGLMGLRFSKDDHSGYGGAQMAKITGTTQDYFGPVYATDDGETPVKEYTEGATTPPKDGIPTE
ncbi:ABC transporter substrate-binding protein [Aeromicrobium wangtongii]|uniref:ABC transporter substrate-binding protein n=1 Tax=Aeromicrobium wangtongii TaxID=2969247 RepID=UPI002017B7CF|nr:ABC transporter substrate-binding protein [Aeromicrobium wangtongii]MCL3817116.1 ABC transporter substrate-binding protein [Aeromicrobium wangtongii]